MATVSPELVFEVFLIATSISKGSSTTMTNPRLNLLTATIKDFQASLAKGEITSVQLVTDYLVGC
jgi:hypothetical protein